MTPTAQALATIKDSLEYICNDESLQPIQAARNALKALSVLTAALEPRQQSQDAPQPLGASGQSFTSVEHGNAPSPCEPNADGLLACPFCGNDAQLGFNFGRPSANCTRCEASIRSNSLSDEDAKKEVTEAWNRRAAHKAQPSVMNPATYWKNEFASHYEGTFDDHVLKTIELIQQDAINCRLDLSEESVAVGKAMSRFFNKNEEIHREAFIDNLCMLIARLAHRLKAHKEHVDDDKLAAEAMEFLRCNGRNGSPLRDDAIRSVKEGGE